MASKHMKKAINIICHHRNTNLNELPLYKSRMEKIQNTNNPNAGKDLEQQEFASTAVGMQHSMATLEIVWYFQQI
jgi:hypothetical protein